MTGCSKSAWDILFGTYHAEITVVAATSWGEASALATAVVEAMALTVSDPATSTEGRLCLIKDDNHSIRVVWETREVKAGLSLAWSFEQMDSEGHFGVFLQVYSSALAPHLITLDDRKWKAKIKCSSTARSL